MRIFGYRDEHCIKNILIANTKAITNENEYKRAFVYAENEDEYKEILFFSKLNFIGKKHAIRFFFDPVNLGNTPQLGSLLSQNYVDITDFTIKFNEITNFQPNEKNVLNTIGARLVLKRDYSFDVISIKQTIKELFNKLVFRTKCIKRKEQKTGLVFNFKLKRRQFAHFFEVTRVYLAAESELVKKDKFKTILATFKTYKKYIAIN